jgi:hypothetical protein
MSTDPKEPNRSCQRRRRVSASTACDREPATLSRPGLPSASPSKASRDGFIFSRSHKTPPWGTAIGPYLASQAPSIQSHTHGAVTLVARKAVIDVIRRELRRVVSVKVDVEELRHALQSEVLKREVFEGDKATAASRQVSRAMNKSLRKASDSSDEPPAPPDLSTSKAAGP